MEAGVEAPATVTRLTVNDFAAIDFETANHHPSSVCSVGVVVVRNGQIADKIYRLIYPEPEWYSYWHTQIHGLTVADTENKKGFSECVGGYRTENSRFAFGGSQQPVRRRLFESGIPCVSNGLS